MKRALLFSLPLLLLSSCAAPPGGSEESASPSLEPSYPSSPWGEEATKACYDALGTVIPYLSSDGFEYETGVDDYGDGIIDFYLFYESPRAAEEAFTAYTHACAEAMYRVEVTERSDFDPSSGTMLTYTLAYADALIAEHLAVEIAFTVSTYKNLPCLGLFCMTYLYSPEDAFPEVALVDLLGEEHGVPSIDGEGYRYDFQFFIDEETGAEALQILVSGSADYTLEETYFSALLPAGFDIFKIAPDGEPTNSLYAYPGIEVDSLFVANRNDVQIFFLYDFSYDAFVLELYPR